MAGLVYKDREIDVTNTGGSMDLIYRTRDGYITAGAVSDAEWAGMCRALKREDLIDDERFKTAVDRFKNVNVRKEITAEEIAHWDSDDILARLDAEDVPCAPLLKRMDLMSHEQILANDTIGRLDYDDFGEVRQARPAAKFSETPAEIRGPGPRLGQHSMEILADLGYDEAERQRLVDNGVIAQSGE